MGVTDATFDVLKDAFSELHTNLPGKTIEQGDLNNRRQEIDVLAV